MADAAKIPDTPANSTKFDPRRRISRDDYADAIERAAIIEEGDGCSRHKAERITANLRGFPTWADLMRAVQR